ncbi:MAG: 3-isopropylmalate/(R)-2-methylmalate dehydratase small subunit [Arcobacteraceae bacterium]
MAPTFARIFYRNAFNMGLPIFELENAADIIEGENITIDLDKGTIENIDKKKTYKFSPIPPFMQELLACGGLMNYAAKEAKNA